MQALMKLVTAFILLTAVSGALSQSISNESEAIERARLASSLLGFDAGLQITTIEPPRSDMGVRAWWLYDDRRSTSFLIEEDTGAVLGATDGALEARIVTRQPGMPRRIVSEADAWAVANRYLEIAGMRRIEWQQGGVRRVGDEPGAHSDRNNRADRWELTYYERAEGYSGYINRASVTIDVVEGRIISASARDQFRFEPPASTLTLGEALARLKEVFAAGESSANAHGATDVARRYRWPGDDYARRHMALRLERGGKRAVRGDDHGPQMRSRHAVRAAWCLSSAGVTICIDAESGKVVAEYVSKSEPPPSASSNAAGSGRSSVPASRSSAVPQEASRPGAPGVSLPVKAGFGTAAAAAMAWLALRLRRGSRAS